MSHFEFVIPLQRDELRHSSRGEYKVEEVLPPEEIKGSIERAIEAYNEEGCTYILDHFDTLYSVLVHFTRLEWPLINKIFDKLILGSLKQLGYFIEQVLEDVSDQETRTRTLNILKMNLYIFTQLHSCTHDKISFENSVSLSDKGKGKKTKKSKVEDSASEWDETQRLAFISVYQLLQLQIIKLWDPPVPDEQFINMCANCCYKSLELPTIAHVKQKPLRETLFQVVGTLVKRYGHGISCVVKFVQLLSLYEHTVSPLAHGVVMFVRELGMKSLVSEIIRELMTTADTAQDNSSVRSFSNFLVEIAELEPKIMIPTTKELTKYLDEDPYSMRCCVLSVLTEILLSQLSHDGMEDEAKEQRDLYLELLEEHSTDVNAFVRSRVLQLWQKIVQQNAVPKAKFLMVVDLALERVTDKSSSVCKHAITLLTTILQHNPYGVQLDARQLADQLLAAEENMQALERKLGSFKNMSREDIWKTIQPEVETFLSSVITFSETEEEESQLTQLLTKDTLQENIKTVAVFLSNRKYEQAYNMVRKIEREFPAAKTIKSGMPESNTLEYYITIMKEMFMMYDPPEEECQPSQDKSQHSENDDKIVPQEHEELRLQRALVIYLLDCLEFSKKVEEAVLTVIMILNEDSIAEVLEAITFITVTYQFGVPKAEKGVQEMLGLVFRKEQAIKEAVNAAYNTLYLTVDMPSKRDKAIEEVNRLSKLASSLDYGQMEALTSLVVGWLKNKELDEEFINVLWDRLKSQNIGKFKKQTALVLLGMVTQEHPTMVKSNLRLLLNHGLRVDCSDPNDAYTVIFTCKVISNISLCKVDSEEQRFPPDFEMFPLLVDIIKEGFTKLEGSEIFIRMAQEVIYIIMEFCSAPNVICGNLLCDLFELMKSETKADQDDDNEALQNETKTDINETCAMDYSIITNPNSNQAKSTEVEGEVVKVKKRPRKMKVKTDSFIRFMFLVGHIAFKYAEFLEIYYLETLKLKLRKKFTTLSPSKDASTLIEISRRSAKFKQDKEDEVVTESDLIAAADDTATDHVRRMLDTEIVSGNGVIAGFSLLIIEVCKHPKKYEDPLVTCTAATALAETMMVSSVFCNEHMQLLVTMLEKNKQESVRRSLVVAFGDLLFKFPNTVEPWTRFLYARLRDESCKVRRNTLLVLSHLVTNEMVKVKGQISEVALCIVDENEEIVELAKRFFSELSLKGNTLYNVLPDIISHLSNPESEITVEEKNFEIILRYIMDQIQKEKQLENLVEKLCKRIKESVCERQWKDLVFCLSLLPWSDRSLRRLIDHAYCFCDRLLYQPVATLFLSIVASVTRSTKPGLKEIGAELNAIIDEVITKGSADHLQNPDDTVSELPSLPTKTPAKNPRKTPRKTPAKIPENRKTVKKAKKSKYCSDSEDDNANSDSSGDGKEIFKAPQKTRSGRTAVKLF